MKAYSMANGFKICVRFQRSKFEILVEILTSYDILEISHLSPSKTGPRNAYIPTIWELSQIYTAYNCHYVVQSETKTKL